MRPPLPHQPPAIEYGVEHDQAIFFMDKRLGKTPMAIRWALARQLRGSVLVVAPKSAIPGWLDELRADEQVAAFDITTTEGKQNWKDWVTSWGPEGVFCLTNAQQLFIPAGRRLPCTDCNGRGYDLERHTCVHCLGWGTRVRKDPQPTDIAMHEWDVVIWDESVVLGNPKCQTTKIANACFSMVPFRCVLSGEYAPEGPQQIFGQMKWALGSFMGCRNYYKWEHLCFDKVGYDLVPKPGMLQRIKAETHAKAFVLSRKAAGIKEVKHFDTRWCDLPQKFRRIYDHAEMWWELPTGEYPSEMLSPPQVGEPMLNERQFRTKYAPVAHNWLRQLAGGFPKLYPHLHNTHKLALMWEVLQEYAHEPVVVSFRYNAEMFAAHAFLEKKGIEADMVWGDLPTKDRKAACDLFQKGQRRILLKQCAVHFGMDLSVSSTIIRYSLPDRFEDLSQDMDRIVHPTKDMVSNPLMYIDLACRDTVDEDVLMVCREKLVDARYFMNRIIQNFKERVARKVTR